LKILTQEKIKWLKGLHLKKNRSQEKCFFVEGRKMLQEALEFAREQISCIVTMDAEISVESLETFDIFHCTQKQMSQISYLTTPSDYFIVLNQATVDQSAGNDKILLLDGIQDPGNLGTIIRTCDWFGVKKIICSPETVEQYNPKVIQATMGSIFRIQLFYTDLVDFVKNANLSFLLTGMNGESIHEKSEVLNNINGVVIGNEGRGISNALREYIKDEIAIPKIGNSDSLNAAVSAGIILSYWTKK